MMGRAVMLTIIALAIVFTLGSGYIGENPGDYGFGAEALRPSFRLGDVPPHSSLADAGLHKGDLVHWPRSDFNARAYRMEPLPGTRVSLITSDGRTVTLVAHASKKQSLPIPLLALKLAYLLVAALLAVRRWQDSAARALIVFLLGFGVAAGLPNANPTGSSQLSFVLFVYGSLALFDVAGVAVAIFSVRFSRFPSDLERLLARGAVISGVVALVASVPVQFVNTDNLLGRIVEWLLLSPFLFAIATIVAGYFTAPPEDRARRRWVLLIIGVGLLGPTVQILVTIVTGYVEAVDQLAALTIAIVPIGLAYVILRHRLIDVGFVLNQAAVYAILSIIVAGIFVIVETLLSNYFTSVNHITSATVQLVVALGLGFSISAIQKRTQGIVARVLFRERYAAHAALHDFTLDAAYITDEGVLLDRCVQTVEKNMRVSHAGVWMRDDSDTYAMRSGDFPAQASVDSNDPAVVAMRARHVVVDLDKQDSRLPGVLAFPMVTGGELVGILICGEKRNQEEYAPDERDAIAAAATAVGYAWRSLRVKELEREVAGLKAIPAR